jgi:hypothetical protein
MSAYLATVAQQLHGLTELLVALVGPPPTALAPDPDAPCDHPAARRVALPSLRYPRRAFCRQCSAFFEEESSPCP